MLNSSSNVVDCGWISAALTPCEAMKATAFSR